MPRWSALQKRHSVTSPCLPSFPGTYRPLGESLFQSVSGDFALIDTPQHRP